MDLLRKLPEPVRLTLRYASRRSLRLMVEVFAGLLVVAAVLFVLAYGRLSRGPVSLAFLVPTLEKAINRELVDVVVRIDDAVVQKSDTGAGVRFRLRNVRLVDRTGAIVAQAPLAAIGLSGRALFAGTIAPGSVDFIGPRLLLFYTDEGGLSLTFANSLAGSWRGQTVLRGAVREPAGSDGPTRPAESIITEGQAELGLGPLAPSRRIDLTKTITAAFERARRRETASSYLSRFGVRDAVVVFEQDGKQSHWQVPDFAIDLKHGEGRSVLIGEANIDAKTGPWSFKFKTEQSERHQSLTFTALVRDLVPNGIAAQFPNVPALESLNIPITGTTSIDLSSSGELKGAEAKIKLAAGHIVVPWDRKHPMLIDEGDFHVRYRALDNRVEILPSTIQWGDSRATIEGDFSPVAGETGTKTWAFRLTAKDAVLAADEFGLGRMRVDQWLAEGKVSPDTGDVTLDRFVIKAGAASIELSGTLRGGEGSPAVKLSGRISPMPASVLKQLWPKFLAGGAREWIGERVTAGDILGGQLAIDMPEGMLAEVERGGDIPDGAVALDLQLRGMEIYYLSGMPPLRTADSRMRITGRRFNLDVPEGFIELPSSKRVEFSEGRFLIDDLRPDPQQGVIGFKVAGGAQALLELLDQERLGYASAVGVKPSDFGGVASGQFRIGLPLLKDLTFSHLKLSGNLRLEQASATGVVENVKLENGTVDFNITEKALDARGDVLVNGVPALLTWQRIFAASEDQQPDLRISAVLDERARADVGLDMSHILRGPVPVIVSLGQGSGGEKSVRVQADLGNADVILAHMGWRKPPGRAAVLKFDVGTGADGRIELQNFKVKGEDIAIQGRVGLGVDGRPRAFHFPDLSFNIVTHIAVEGRLREDNVWEVNASGSRYDGRQFFESLFSAGQLAADQPELPEAGPGLDLTAQIGTMIGFFDTTVRDVRIRLKKRSGALTDLSAEGQLNGKTPIAVRLQREDGEDGKVRVIVAETKNAGAAFRLVGFYPRIEGGEASIKVDMDAAGPGRKTGTLWARSFNIIGDRVVSEVLSSSGDEPIPGFGTPEPARRRSSAAGDGRVRVYFNQLRVPFEVGGGMFTVHSSYINGPRLGATIRGHVDFKSKEVDLSGTYVPLYGLNSALGAIPIIGNILVGRRGEGLVGITFGIQGTTENPLVRVNPVSVVAPGIFRQIFEFGGGGPARAPRRRGPEETTPSDSPDTFAFPSN